MSSVEEPDTAAEDVSGGEPSAPLAPFDTSLPLPTNDNAGDMPVFSKEVAPTDKYADLAKPATSDDGIFSLVYSFLKKVTIVGSIYLVGYMGWSVAWLIAPVLLSVARDQVNKSTEHKRNIAKASALANEKDVILARIDELPAWVYFPDVERCEWVNKILKQIWPNANHFARALVKETIEPKIVLQLENRKISGFRFDRFILGTIPPRIGGVKIYDKNTDRNEIIMDLDLFYASDCDINFYLRGMKGGIKDFQIHGWMRVVMKPLIKSVPLVGGLQIFFLNNPNIDFNLVGVIDFMDMPGLSDLLRRIIVECISNVMVLPHKLPITLSHDLSPMDLRMPEPEGVVRIHVVEAKDLMKKDIGVLGKGKSDPYTVINVGAQEFKTQTIENNVNPKWDYWCEAIIQTNGAIAQEVGFNLFDWDKGVPGVKDDDRLGRATIEVNSVVKKGVVDTWLTLEDAKHGLLHVRLQWYRLTADAADLQAALQEIKLLHVASMSTAVLIVYIDSAKNLKQARSSSKPDPYLVASVGKQKEQTGMIMRDDSPVWEQGFTFLVSNPENENLQIKIYDQKTGNDIGQYTYGLSPLLGKQNMDLMAQPFQLQKSGPESKLIMSLSLRILKRADVVEEPSDATTALSSESPSEQLTRSSSMKTPSVEGSNSNRDLFAQALENPIPEEERIDINGSQTSSSQEFTAPYSTALASGEAVLTHRSPETQSTAGDYGLGRIQLTIRYSVHRQRLVVIIHKINNIPLKDPSNIPDPYVKLYLLPGRSKESKRKTAVIKDNCNPVYESTFEYLISTAELMQTELEVTVATAKGIFGSPIIGMLKIPLSDGEISANGLNSWFDLQPEMKHE